MFYKFINRIFDFILCKLFSLETMRPYDLYWLNSIHPPNAITMVSMEKFDPHEIAQHSYERLIKYSPGIANGVTQHFGKHYRYMFSKEEFTELWFKKLIIVHHDVHTEERLMNLIHDLMRERLDVYNLPVIRFHMIPDYKDGKGLWVCQTDHTGADGISFWGCMVSLTDEMDFSSLPQIKAPTFVQRMFSKIMTPYYAVDALY